LVTAAAAATTTTTTTTNSSVTVYGLVVLGNNGGTNVKVTTHFVVVLRLRQLREIQRAEISFVSSPFTISLPFLCPSVPSSISLRFLLFLSHAFKL
jgi:hypothetical protein